MLPMTRNKKGKSCKNCVWFYLDHADPISPGCASCALGQNPTEVPCGHYSEKKDVQEESASKQPVAKEDDVDINIPWAIETFIDMN